MLLINLGSAALLARELDQARPLFAEALRISDEIDDRVAQYILLDLLGCHAAEFNAGKRLSRDAAIGTALGEPAHVVATPDDASVAPLAKREADVARLVAEGLSNKQIGARLFISERTVDSHVRSILDKLGFNSRAQIAGWMASSNQ
jgi:DNA-binding NarL/FixJ family response regulator